MTPSSAPPHPSPAVRWAPWWVVLYSLVVLLPSIWSDASVTGSDEYTLSLRTPMEMLEHGHWLTPWLDNQPRLRKPPLLYWLVLINYKVFGWAWSQPGSGASRPESVSPWCPA